VRREPNIGLYQAQPNYPVVNLLFFNIKKPIHQINRSDPEEIDNKQKPGASCQVASVLEEGVGSECLQTRGDKISSAPLLF
jgi:hypothetical protein